MAQGQVFVQNIAAKKERITCNFMLLEPSTAACRSDGQVAQSVEQWTENPRVGGSIPPLTTVPTSQLFDGSSCKYPLRVSPFVLPKSLTGRRKYDISAAVSDSQSDLNNRNCSENFDAVLDVEVALFLGTTGVKGGFDDGTFEPAGVQSW